MIQRHELFHMPFYKKTKFTGSYEGMRYLIRSEKENEDTFFMAYVYPGPYNFEHVAEEELIQERFPFSEEGLDQICDWLNQQYEKKPEEWKKGKILY